MISDKMMELSRKVARMTKEGAIIWKETERDDVFQVSFASSSLRIAKRQSRSSGVEPEFYISVINSEGSVVDEIGDEDSDSSGRASGLFVIFRDCYETARRQALGIESVLDGILGELNEIDPDF